MAADFLERMGARIRERRDALGLSRAEVARRMPGKVNENQVYRWEKGQHQPNPDTLEALAGVLGCNVSEFLTPAPEETETPDLSTPGATQLDRIEQKLDRLLAMLPKGREQADQLRRALLAAGEAAAPTPAERASVKPGQGRRRKAAADGA